MLETNLARNNFEIQQYVNDRLKSPKKQKSRRHSRSCKSVLEESFASMSIVNSDDDNDNSTIESRFTTPRQSRQHRQEISNNIDETESQYQSKVKGKLQKVYGNCQHLNQKEGIGNCKLRKMNMKRNNGESEQNGSRQNLET